MLKIKKQDLIETLQALDQKPYKFNPNNQIWTITPKHKKFEEYEIDLNYLGFVARYTFKVK